MSKPVNFSYFDSMGIGTIAGAVIGLGAFGLSIFWGGLPMLATAVVGVPVIYGLYKFEKAVKDDGGEFSTLGAQTGAALGIMAVGLGFIHHAFNASAEKAEQKQETAKVAKYTSSPAPLKNTVYL